MDDTEWVLIDEWSEPDPSIRPPEPERARRLALRRRLSEGMRAQRLGDPSALDDADIRIDTVVCCGPEPIDRHFRLWVRRRALEGSKS